MIEKFPLKAVFPFRLDLTVWALRRRKSNMIDLWDGRRYTRVAVFNKQPVKISVVQEYLHDNPEISLFSQDEPESAGHIKESALLMVKKMLGLDLDLRPFYSIAENDEVIGPLVRQFRGVKPPRFPTIFEALVNAIACQQVTLEAGIVMLNRLAEKFGRVCDGAVPLHAFPGPEGLAHAAEEDIKKLGFSYQKARAIKELALSLTDEKITLAELEGMSDREAVEYLSTLRGIGRWSAEYVLLRGLGRLDMFPGDDVGAQNNLQRLFNLDHKPGYEEIKELTSRWHPYEGLVYFHLLLEKLHLRGAI